MHLELDTQAEQLPREFFTILSQIHVPENDSHKGQNGKLLLIGGSTLFHAASKWSLDTASYVVDMVFYSSVSENNELVYQAKQEFWNGIVIERINLENYIEEADCVLIGPGMERNQETEDLVAWLLTTYPQKKVVIDAGALQMIDVLLLSQQHIITPHAQEMAQLEEKLAAADLRLEDVGTTVLLKGKVDLVTWYEDRKKAQCSVSGGNPGMTKGGTGDVLAGLVAGLYCTSPAHVAAIIGSYVNKAAGDDLNKKVGTYFNTTDLVEQIPQTLWRVLSDLV